MEWKHYYMSSKKTIQINKQKYLTKKKKTFKIQWAGCQEMFLHITYTF